MLNIVRRLAELCLILALAAPTIAAPTPARTPDPVGWPQKCLKLKYYSTEIERKWRGTDKLHQMVSDRDIWSLQSTLRKDMLKGSKPVPVPYLYNASGITVPGYFEYDPGMVRAKAAMERQGAEVVRLLIWAGANPDERGLHGTVALMVVAMSHPSMPKVSPGIVRQLLAAGANPNLRDVNGWTALMFAAENGATDIARQLIAAGARRDYRNCAGQTAADIAKAKGFAPLARLIRDSK
jgi:hypothetical protein